MTIVIIQFISVTLFDIIFEIMIQAVAVQIAINIKRMRLISLFYIIVFGPFLLPVYYFNHVSGFLAQSAGIPQWHGSGYAYAMVMDIKIR